ncbi:hypothetical protein F0562_023383 [Nyssa sinensis]|uniref:PGG domain-containing protein n=1 Tax=Nyssa sinensis TaxID=561372 RepID=A0A5J5BMX7_9ASTE|nr:hypothetical protein F0562_023383 [Nyssa sinensis]
MASSSSSSFSQYPHPSMINVGNFVSVKLTTANYPLWEAQMLSLIVSQNLVGFIDGQNVVPPQRIIVRPDVRSELTAEIENPEYQAWRRTDWLLKGWIIGSLSEEVLGLVVMSDWKSDTARVVWDRLAIAFAPHSDQKPKPEIQSQTVEKTKTEGRGFEFTTEQKGKIEELFEAIKSGQRFSVVKNLVESMSSQELAQQDEETSFTALHGTALAGNVQLAKLLVKKAPLLPNIKASGGNLPLHFAAGYRHREMTSYLMKVTKDEKKTEPFEDQSDVFILRAVMTAKFYGVALDLLQKNPDLAWQELSVPQDPSDVALDPLQDEDNSASQPSFPVLEFMAQDPSSFPSGRRMNILQRLIYSCVYVKSEDLPNHPNGGDMEKGVQIIKGKIMSVFQNLHGVVWKALEILVPWIKDIRYTKLMHREALELIKYLCNQAKEEDVELLESPLLFGAQHGIHEVVEEILKYDMGKGIFEIVNEENQNAFHLAVMYHREKVFNILYQFVQFLPTHIQKRMLPSYQDQNGNNVLHLAGNMARQDRLDLVSGGALQMQRDLQWFKEVEKLVDPLCRNLKNKKGKTPLMIFHEEHENLVKSESQWVQGMASSCTLAASLVATVVFAAAITIPGGNSNNGVPIFSRERALIIFAISDALALFSSVSSVLSFLSVLTSRYAVIDFLHTLPRRLIIGLVALFISVTSVIIAFSAALYLVFGQRKAWFLILVSAMACLPVALFMFMQLPLLLDMIKSTYGPGIIRKPSERNSLGLRRKMQEFGASICNSVRRIKFLK